MATVLLRKEDRRYIEHAVSGRLREKRSELDTEIQNHLFVKNISKYLEANVDGLIPTINTAFYLFTPALVGVNSSSITSTCITLVMDTASVEVGIDMPNLLYPHTSRSRFNINDINIGDPAVKASFIEIVLQKEDLYREHMATLHDLRALLESAASTQKLEEVWPTATQYYSKELKKRIDEKAKAPKKLQAAKKEIVKPTEQLEQSLILLNLGI